MAESKQKNELVEQGQVHEIGEFDTITFCPYSSAQLKRIRDCVGSNLEAERRGQEILLIATGHLNRKPQPVETIHYESLVNTDPKRTACVEHLLDMRVLGQVLQNITILQSQGLNGDFWSYKGTKGGSLKKSVALLLPYARREKVYHQWRNSIVKLDKRRAAAGIAKYQPGVAFDPTAAIKVLEWATPYQTGLAPIIADLLKRENTNFPTWRLVELHCLGENKGENR